METASLSALDLSTAKIVSERSILNTRLNSWRVQGLRIGFTNGCFDLLHPGHVKVLQAARAACDRLVVGLNSDQSVARLKGPGRPIFDERGRAQMLAALEGVDLVVVFTEDTPLELIRAIQPNVLVKGGDYARDMIVGSDLVEAAGGTVVVVDLFAGYSTTSIISRLLELRNSAL